MCIYIYIHTHTYSMYIYITLVLYYWRSPHVRRRDAHRKGTNGVSTNGVTANFMLFDRGTFWVLPLTCLYIPKSARAYLVPQSVGIPYFCSGPISV